MRQEFLIDDEGRPRSIGESGLARAYESDMPSAEFVHFAIRNLGFVHAVCSAGRWNVRMRPKVVAPAAIVGTMLLLSDLAAAGGSISCLDADQWRDEIAGSFDRLMARLASFDRRKLAAGSRRFISRSNQIIRLKESDPLGQLLRICEERRAQDPASVARACEPLVAGRLTLAETGDGDTFFVRHTGTGYRVYDRNYLDSNSGRRIDDDPDEAYGQWVASSYRAAVSTGSAMVQDVDAIIRGTRNGLERVCYRRVIVPLSASGRSRFVLSASVLDTTVDLRAAAD